MLLSGNRDRSPALEQTSDEHLGQSIAYARSNGHKAITPVLASLTASIARS